jgi:dienelactone hydrolase
MQTRFWKVLLALIVVAAASFGVPPLVVAEEEPVRTKFLETPSGIRFGWLGEKTPRPAPTLFLFAKDMQSTLERDVFAKVAWLLTKQGFITVALDLPCHGADEKPGEPPRLAGWCARVEGGDSLVPAFVSKASQVLDFLIQSGHTDPKRVAACGISRGGFMAIHFTAAEPRVKCVAALAPVTDLRALSEFAGMKNETASRSLSLMNVADKIAGRGVWVYIGNDDERVGTDNAIAFTRLVTRLAVAKKQPANVKLTVDALEGHGVGLPPHIEAAEWIEAQLVGTR